MQNTNNATKENRVGGITRMNKGTNKPQQKTNV